jgi:hypothetical protein
LQKPLLQASVYDRVTNKPAYNLVKTVHASLSISPKKHSKEEFPHYESTHQTNWYSIIAKMYSDKLKEKSKKNMQEKKPVKFAGCVLC